MATWIGSPNYSQGRSGKRIEFIVIHWIVGTVAAADAVFKNPNSQVSAHYAIGPGVIHQYVNENDTAWHAGNFDINQKSIGIEHQGGPNLPIEDGTYETSAQLIADICRRYGLQANLGIIRKHREIPGASTQCPGSFDLNRLINRVNQLLKGDESMELLSKEQEAQLYRDYLGREPEKGASLGKRTELQWLRDAKGEIQSIVAEIKELNKIKAILESQLTELNKKVEQLQKDVDKLASENEKLKQNNSIPTDKFELLKKLLKELFS